MQRAFTSGPGQNIDWTQHGVERSLPHLFAHALNIAEAGARGQELTTEVQFWNNNTPTTTKEWETYCQAVAPITFEEYCKQSIASKLELLRQYGFSRGADLQVFTDTSPLVRNWINEKIDRLMSASVIYKARGEFHVCRSCGNVIAEAAAEGVGSCKLCLSTDLSTSREDALFVDFPVNRDLLIHGRFCGPVSKMTQRELSNRFKLLPPRAFINKRRMAGFALEVPGFEGFVVDPKIAIALLPEYAAVTLGIQELVQIQSISTATNTIPYTSLFNLGDFTNLYVFIQKAPKGALAGISETERGFFGHLFSHLTTRNTPMKPEEYELLHQDYRKAASSAETAMLRLGQAEAIGEMPLEEDVSQSIDAIRVTLLKSEYGEAARIARNLVNKVLIPKYAQRCRSEQKHLSRADFIMLSQVLRMFYAGSRIDTYADNS